MSLALRAVLLLAWVLAWAPVGCGGSEPAPSAQTEGATWTCAMHPGVRAVEPGACPICGMDLVPTATGDDGGAPDRVVLSDRARALARLRTTVVRRQSDAAAEVRLLGRVEPAETTRRNVTTWVGGRIDRLHVNTTGERVRRGQVIASMYSPEVYAAHQDLLTARSQVGRLADAAPSARQAAEAALRTARERLTLLGVPEAELDAMAEATEPARTIAIRSPFSGTVIERAATEGAYVDTGATLYRVADLGTLWVQLDAYESDLPQLSVGQPVALRVDALPGEEFVGRVDFIDPTVDAQRRTARVRVVVDNASGQLRPGMFAEAVVQAGQPDGTSPLVIPASAPLFTGRRAVVYVEVEADRGPAYAPRTVRLGPRLGDVYPVVTGLSAGERVVSRGAFALDADLQIRGGPSMMTLDDDRAADAPAPIRLPGAERAQLAPVVTAYLALQRALAADDLPAALASATDLEAAVAAVDLASAEGAWAPIASELSTQSRAAATAPSLEDARGGFEALSAAVEALLTRFGNPLDEAVHVAFCPMALGNEGARWVQVGTTIDNAYFGASMRSCGEIRDAVAPGAWLSPDPSAPPPDLSHEGHDH